MKQTKIGNRFVVIAGTAPANKQAGYRQHTDQRRSGLPKDFEDGRHLFRGEVDACILMDWRRAWRSLPTRLL